MSRADHLRIENYVEVHPKVKMILPLSAAIENSSSHLAGDYMEFPPPYWQVNRFYQYARPVQATTLLEFHVSIFSVTSKRHYLGAGDQHLSLL